MNQIISISPQESNILGRFREDKIFILCDTDSGGFSVIMPQANLQKVHELIIYNTGSNDFTLNFNVDSLLYFFDGSLLTLSIGSGISMSMFNEPVNKKWRVLSTSYSGSNSQIRWIWEDNRLKGQVFENGVWNNCIRGGY